MKRSGVLTIFIFVLLFNNLKAQTVYIGYPDSSRALKKGDIIILSPLPWNWDGHLDASARPYFINLIQFMLKHLEFTYDINIHEDYRGNKKYLLKFSQYQGYNLDDFFKYDTLFVKRVKYKITGKGMTELLFTRKMVEKQTDEMRKRMFMILNRRLELVLN